jgi:hypothetical protein
MLSNNSLLMILAAVYALNRSLLKMICYSLATANIFTTKNAFNLISNGSLIQLLSLLYALMLVVNKI